MKPVKRLRTGRSLDFAAGVGAADHHLAAGPHRPVEGSVDLLPFAVDRGSLTRAVVLFQTYAGTALIVLLGYVLGNRDPI